LSEALGATGASPEVGLIDHAEITAAMRSICSSWRHPVCLGGIRFAFRLARPLTLHLDTKSLIYAEMLKKVNELALAPNRDGLMTPKRLSAF